MKYLRILEDATGASFAWPRTFDQADEQIRELKKLPRRSSDDRRRETFEVRRDMAERRGDAAAVREHELTGWGSGARWADDSEEDDDGRDSAW